jgi:hypothetical protein
MSRLRQLNAQNYFSSGQINEEFESVVRYLNSAELGNKTIAELLDAIFDDDGNFDGVVELRLDTASGIQYRTGEFNDPETGWKTIVPVDELRGNDGKDVGQIGEPVFQDRVDFTATGGETEIDVAHDAGDVLVVYSEGLLLTEGAGNDYTSNPTGGTGGNGSVTFLSALGVGEKISVFRLYDGVTFDISRYDEETVGLKSNFGFVHTRDASIQVYKNGVLMREGVTFDYFLDPDNDLVVFNTAVPGSTKIAIIGAEPIEDVDVTGLMIESRYTDLSGYIPYTKLVIQDDEIPQAKVEQLVATLAVTPDITIGASTPNPATRFWVDTSVAPNQLKFYDGTKYLSANPASAIPTFDDNNALQFLQVDATGTQLEYSDVDFSSLIPKSQKGAANGVATLSSSARIPVAQMPETIAYDSINVYQAGGVADGSFRANRYFKQKVIISAIELRTDTGTCDVQIEIDGVPVGSTYNVSNTPTSDTLSNPITVDATLSSKLVSIVVSNGAAPTNLDIVMSVKVQSQ